MHFYRFLPLVLLTTIACDVETKKPTDEEEEEEGFVDDSTDPFAGATTGGETDAGETTDGGSTGGEAAGDGTTGGETDDDADTGSDAEGSDTDGGTDEGDSSDDSDGDIGGIDGGGTIPDGGGSSDGSTGGSTGASSGGSTGDGSFDVDVMYIFFNGAYRDGLSTTATYIDEEGESAVADNYFQFAWVDSYDYTGDPEEYICILSYKTGGATEADFSEFGIPDSAYMQFLMDLPATTPEASGDCEGAAMAFGLSDIKEFVEATSWGFGYGPMTDAFEDEIAEALEDYASLGDRPGATYLRWQDASGDVVNSWGYFQVIPFLSDDASELTLDLSTEEEITFASGVRDSTEPTDGFFSQTTVYVLTFGP